MPSHRSSNSGDRAEGQKGSAAKKVIVVSAVNLVEGGTLKILKQCLEAALVELPENWEIWAIVNGDADIHFPRVKFVPYSEHRMGWAQRIEAEWFGMRKRFAHLDADLWLSLHDATPRVRARRQAVYCHNSAPFYHIPWREAWLEPKTAIFTVAYGMLYRLFAKRNFAMIVQQDWMRQEVRKLTGFSNIIVAHPRIASRETAAQLDWLGRDQGPLRLLYPTLPRAFKNIEILCEAVARLDPDVARKVDLRLTIDGTQNPYDKWIVDRFRDQTGISFIGRLAPDEMHREYEASDIIVFPSKLESWGLPVSEATEFKKALIAADLPYAREAVGTYADVMFLPVDDAARWASAIEDAVSGVWTPDGHVQRLPEEPFAQDWSSLWKMLIKGL